MLKLKISQKSLLFFLAVSLIPLLVVTLYWFRLAQTSLRSAAASQESLLTTGAVTAVDQFLTDKVNLLIIHSQTSNIESFSLAGATKDLTNLTKQDADIEQVTLADSSGKELAAVNQDGSTPSLQNISNSDAFRATTFLSGKEYISPVNFDSKQQPFITIAVPLVTFDTSQSLSDLSTSEQNLIRSSQGIKGVLIAKINLSSLWHSVLSQKLGQNGYAFVVDSQGTLIAYPDSKFLATHHDLHADTQVSAFINNPTTPPAPTITNSEKGVQVLSSYQMVPRTEWGVIAEEPTSSIFADANHVATTGTAIFGVVALAVVGMSFVFSRRLTRPIKQLVVGAEMISQGKLDTRINSHEQDEIGVLANTFNAMAVNLDLMVQRARADSAKVNVILDNVGEGVIAVDKDGTILVANVAGAVLAGGLPQNVIGHQFSDLFHLTKTRKPFSPSLTTTTLYKDVTLAGVNGRVHYLDVLANHIINDPMGITAIFTIIDRTDERELESMKLDFVSMAAHELRTPMTAIRGYLNIILGEETEALPAETLGRLQKIQSSSTQLVGLINNLLNVSKIERGTMTLHLDKIDINQIAQNAISDQQFSASAKNITMTYQGTAEPTYILGDNLAIMEVINNLVSNAINYTDNLGHIEILLENTPEGITLSVKDDGVGISANAQERLFTKFYRVHGGLTSGSGGTGLGLYISRSIVEQHEGIISCQSMEGEGSTFTVKLPHFDNDKYTGIINQRPVNLKKSHGWTTKNTTR
jgi:two-component system phosphate regulon sensor histidine kinase PhoR